MSGVAIFAQLLQAHQQQAEQQQQDRPRDTLWPIVAQHNAPSALMVVAPQLRDSALLGLQQRLSNQSLWPTVVRVAERDGHQALILATEPVPERVLLRQWSDELQIDIGVRHHSQPWTWPRLALFDMDSTLITMEVIDELAKEAGVGEQVAAITEAAMRGELDFNASLTRRVATLQHLPLTVIERVRNRLQFNPGVPDFAQRARTQQCHLALVSGGFIPFAQWVKAQLQFDFARANELAVAADRLTGQVVGEIVNADVKARTLHELAQQLAIASTEVMAVGDGANDLLMLQASGFGVAFRAKPKLRMAADLALDVSDMRGLNALFE